MYINRVCLIFYLVVYPLLKKCQNDEIILCASFQSVTTYCYCWLRPQCSATYSRPSRPSLPPVLFWNIVCNSTYSISSFSCSLSPKKIVSRPPTVPLKSQPNNTAVSYYLLNSVNYYWSGLRTSRRVKNNYITSLTETDALSIGLGGAKRTREPERQNPNPTTPHNKWTRFDLGLITPTSLGWGVFPVLLLSWRVRCMDIWIPAHSRGKESVWGPQRTP